MTLQFKATITEIGMLASEALEENMLILFNQTAPEEVKDYCFIHDQGLYSGMITTQSTLLIADKDFIVTAVGSAVSQNLANLGHITIKFDGKMDPEQPGTVHVIGHRPNSIHEGDEIVFG
ncbi:PTS glucitol/sorbitol transporter subunit IIA [Vibrio fluvialis]|uniref:PTS glucitol/sorbitol transporter subunit IIA n=1 Tax=Vibrio fluvialis TaxID=676 RepID=UPI000571E317|nr:PTS glucitol/sorbitol transporter subunit IIA [Vibrio fluvialis]MBL4259971.1 PTS glucitol/sorbitol transporter subunit IIA [Vibrio fluvialis]MBY7796613.1 PTS glucitol/sorbitol transporter subunit IIA [Vibrio fluvialis]MBY7967283.1 PTS glucitol/sorbitol transporter subunit IIA [Vibrio fluvialis]MBY8108387.1 PTS glucitol/sorbitol transporter subunit IIA [Vibrio fluvialis]MBY8203946.1 PTS glucitol/sorbitol transporter subunit IIA [Vibrio fluvialis]